MIFISLNKAVGGVKITRKMAADGDKLAKQLSKEGIKILGQYWTLGRYDSVWIFEAPNEKTAMKLGVAVSEAVKTETLVAVTREDALELLE